MSDENKKQEQEAPGPSAFWRLKTMPKALENLGKILPIFVICFQNDDDDVAVNL